MTILFQRERAHALWAEITPLLEKHWQEIAHFKDVPLEPDVERYNAMEDAGLLRCYTARVDGVLVGYAVFFAGSLNMHYKSCTVANNDVVFLHPDYRRGRLGLQLVDFCESRLREEVQVVYWHVKAAHPALGKILARRGYKMVDEIYAKRG
jgi:GNAT superfamily N-acetyltransferase